MHEERKIKDINFYCTVLFVYKCKHNRLPLVCNQFFFQFLTANTYTADGSYNLRSVIEYITPFSRTNMRTKCVDMYEVQNSGENYQKSYEMLLLCRTLR